MTPVTPTVGAFLRTIFNLQEDRIPVRRARLRDRLGLAGPTVTQAVMRMIDAGLIHDRRDQYLELTDLGTRAAVIAVRRHRLTERLLTDVLKLPAQFAHAESINVSHTLSEETEQAIISALDDPRFSPWGNPIPGLEQFGITVPALPSATWLYQLGAPGTCVTATVRAISEDAQDDPQIASALVGAGIIPRARIHIRVGEQHYELCGLSRFDVPAAMSHMLQLDMVNRD